MGEHVGEAIAAKYPRPTVPDYKSFRVEDAPELMKLERKLAARGLKDPWIRNYVWQYQLPEYEKPWVGALKVMTRGLKGALLITAVCVVSAKLYGKYKPEWLKTHDCRKSGCWEHDYNKN